MRRKIKIALTITALTICSQASGANKTLKSGYAACLTESLFDEMSQSISRKDDNHKRYLLKNGCIFLRSGLTYSLLEKTWSGKAKVRAYSESDSFILWTNVEATR